MSAEVKIKGKHGGTTTAAKPKSHAEPVDDSFVTSLLNWSMAIVLWFPAIFGLYASLALIAIHGAARLAHITLMSRVFGRPPPQPWEEPKPSLQGGPYSVPPSEEDEEDESFGNEFANLDVLEGSISDVAVGYRNCLEKEHLPLTCLDSGLEGETDDSPECFSPSSRAVAATAASLDAEEPSERAFELVDRLRNRFDERAQCLTRRIDAMDEEERKRCMRRLGKLARSVDTTACKTLAELVCAKFT